MKSSFYIKFLLLFFTGFLVSTTQLHAHPIKMSTAKLYGKAESNKLFLTINFFEDDLLAYFRELYQIPVFHYGENTDLLHESLNEYVNIHLSIIIDDQPAHLEIIESEEKQDNVITVNFKLIPEFNVNCIREITIENKILFDGFKDQTNIMVIELNDLNKTKNLRFFRHHPREQISFDTSNDCGS